MADVLTSSVPEGKKFLATLPFRSEQRDAPEYNLDVSVWRSDRNLCEHEEKSTCDTATGLYYGSAEDEVTKFCPRHFYEMHYGANAPYRLVDTTPAFAVSDVTALAQKAQDAFWAVIVRQFPQARYGDLSPERTIAFNQAAETAIKEWIRNNVIPPHDDGNRL